MLILKKHRVWLPAAQPAFSISPDVGPRPLRPVGWPYSRVIHAPCPIARSPSAGSRWSAGTPGWTGNGSAGFCFWGLAPSPNPAARDMASGLHHSLALALTLSRPFRRCGKESDLKPLRQFALLKFQQPRLHASPDPRLRSSASRTPRFHPPAPIYASFRTHHAA